MWKLHRYYLRELTINASITFLVMFAVVLVSLVARGIQRSMGGEMLDAAKITLFFALDMLPHLFTIAFLIATVLTFSRATQDRELIAVRAAGVSPRVPMTAAVLLGMVIAVCCSIALHYVIPDVHYRKYRIVADVVRNAFMKMNLGRDRLQFDDFVITYRDFRDGAYVDCTVYCPPGRSLQRDLRSSILRVDRVSIDVPQTGGADVRIVPEGLRDPIFGGRSGAFEIAFAIDDLGGRDRRIDRDDDLRSDQLLAEVLREIHPQPRTAIYTLFRRCCFSLLPVLLAPIGFCIAEFARERGRVMALLFALVPLGMFYLGEVLGARLLISTDSPWVAWLPVALLLSVGAPLCWRQLRR